MRENNLMLFKILPKTLIIACKTIFQNVDYYNHDISIGKPLDF